ncbi:MAG: tRNA (N(6)-L-threonylcarbamoyladenosine(37)-C(2))-methylthiotransferase MtaB [Rhodobacteraceae bacterium]|nr:tRNA (N(6)-L-threonylcarbamoyladenosine(37)-C(2))-methylthiotransferase MtaB [Paracoccaceae bacterium]
MSELAPDFHTLGCRLNAYETEAMSRLSAKAGLGAVKVINTCAVTSEAVRQAKLKIRRLRRENPGHTIVVTGCAAQVEPTTFAAMAEVDLVLGNHEKLDPQTWAGIASGASDTLRVQVRDIMAEKAVNSPLIDGLGTRARAYVQVQNGCDHRCTFCIIPYGRGNSRSVPQAVVVEQMQRLVDKGFNEVVLTGVDMTSWGADLDGKQQLGDLVQMILTQVPDLPRLRISSIDSIEADAALIDAIRSEQRLMPHLHLSLQAGDDMILKRMKRRHLRDDAIGFCQMLKAARPGITFGADIIAGFPTETEKMFENSLALVKDCDLTWLHVFPYSVRQGTPAAKMPQVNGRTIRERARRLRQAGEHQVTAYLAARTGETHNILMESPRMGRTETFAPVRFGSDQTVGQIVRAVIAGHDSDALCA